MSEGAEPRALLLTPTMPSDRGNGLAMRAGVLLEGLARAFAVDVLVVPLFADVTGAAGFAARLARSVEIVPLDRLDPLADMTERLATPEGRARARALHPLPALCRGLGVAGAEAVAAGVGSDLDVVIVFRSYLAPLLDGLLELPERPAIILDLDELESGTQRRLGQVEQAERFERLERFYLPLLDRVVTAAPEDARLLAERHGLRAVICVPNAVRPPARLARPSKPRYDLLLVGNLSYPPNIEAACWLCGAVLPLLGDVRVALVGSGPGGEVRALASDPRVTVAADVEDVTPWYEDSAVAVVPVLRGGGSRIKLIEALAHGRPVVSTPAGAEGVPWSTGSAEILRVAETAEGFAAACRSLLSDPDQAAQLGTRGAELVGRTATVDVVAPRIAELAVSVAGGRKPRRSRRRRQPFLAAVLIVRDEEAVLGECLDSLRDLADQTVVVDTGSVDASVQIARAHGAEVLHRAWDADFSAPRNLGLDHARGQWILYLDADERVRPLARERLEARLSDSEAIGVRVLLRPFIRATPYFEYRLWRNDPRIRFTGVMHERVVDAIHLAGIADGRPVEDWSELELDHVGYEGDQTAKHARNLPLLEEQLRRTPNAIFHWRHLAGVLAGLGRTDEAERALERAVSLARAEEPPSVDGSLAWADLVRLRHEHGADVTDLLAVARTRWPEQWLMRWIEGLVHLDGGRFEQAEECFTALLAVDVSSLPERGIAYDERIFGAYAQASLGLALFRGGRYAEAAAAYADAERSDPGEQEYRVKRLLAQAQAAGARSGLTTPESEPLHRRREDVTPGDVPGPAL
jgi:glycosyltransferase involved in cell wall biosynthesis/tetratricopeptide (TPR) repeat protein